MLAILDRNSLHTGPIDGRSVQTGEFKCVISVQKSLVSFMAQATRQRRQNGGSTRSIAAARAPNPRVRSPRVQNPRAPSPRARSPRVAADADADAVAGRAIAYMGS